MRYTPDEIVKQSELVSKLHGQTATALARLQHMLTAETAEPTPDVEPTLISPAGKLTEHGVEEMYRLFEKDWRDSRIADQFGISQSAVHARRKTWKRLKHNRSK